MAIDASLIGTWDWVGYTDMFGKPQATTGYWEFRANGTYTINGSFAPLGIVTPVDVEGTWAQTGNSLTFNNSTDASTLTWSGRNEVTLSESPANSEPTVETNTLRRRYGGFSSGAGLAREIGSASGWLFTKQ